MKICNITVNGELVPIYSDVRDKPEDVIEYGILSAGSIQLCLQSMSNKHEFSVSEKSLSILFQYKPPKPKAANPRPYYRQQRWGTKLGGDKSVINLFLITKGEHHVRETNSSKPL